MPIYKKISLLSTKPKTSKLKLLIISFIIILLIASFKIKTYSTYKTLAIMNCEEQCFIETTLPSNKNNIINKNLSIIYDNHKYKVNKIYLDDIVEENGIILLNIKLDTELKLEKNTIIDIKIIYDQQRIITKLKNIMKG